MTERTLVLIKPDGVARNLVGEVLSRIERKGLPIVALELRTLDRAAAEAHYGEHADKPFFADLVDFITGGPLVAAVVEGPEAIVQWRAMMGATNPATAAPARSAATWPRSSVQRHARLRLRRPRRPARSPCSSPSSPDLAPAQRDARAC